MVEIINGFEDLKTKVSELCKKNTSEMLLELCGLGVDVRNSNIRFFQTYDKSKTYYNLEIIGLEKTTSNFNELQQILNANGFSNEQEWSNYPSVKLLTDKGRSQYFGKIQIGDKDCLKINFSKYDDRIIKVLEVLLTKYRAKNKNKTALAEYVLKIVTDNRIDVFEETDCIYEDGFWDITLIKDCGFTYFFDKSKGNHYLNFRGFYLGHNSEDFKKKINDVFSESLKDLNSITRLGSDVADEIQVAFNDDSANLKINFKNTGFFGIVFKNEQELIDNSKISQLINHLLDLQKIKLGIPAKSGKLAETAFTIGLINEFAFPVKSVQEQIKSILIDLGYQENNIQLLTIIDKEKDITPIDSTKINIITNIASEENIELIKEETANKVIFIACGLEHDLASVSKQKVVKEFKARIQNSDEIPDKRDYENIGDNLATNSELKKLQDGINKCYHQADFFLTYESDKNSKLSKHKLKQQLKRFFNLLHGFPFATPTKDEYAMYLAFSSALRSADLSRQVGAVITATNGDILATGANDIPKNGGGLYRAHLNQQNGSIYDDPLGRDYMRGVDANATEIKLLVDNIYDALKSYVDINQINDIKSAIAKSKLKDITEYGRVVHAEMEALMACARNNVSSDGAILYCTTFPCHNCAKHIIAAGIKRVVYIEPYAKSKALPFHFDSVVDEEPNPIEELIKDKLEEIKGKHGNGCATNQHEKVKFESFVGVGPNLFRQLFKMRKDSRKEGIGEIKTSWTPQLIEL